jgi:hypothetical protein
VCVCVCAGWKGRGMSGLFFCTRVDAVRRCFLTQTDLEKEPLLVSRSMYFGVGVVRVK